MLKLLGRATSGNVQKVLFLLEETGTSYEREDYGRQFGNTATPQYKAMNPNSKVPTLVDGEVMVWESNTILRYLAAGHAPEMHGTTPAERSEVERWMDWLLAQLNAPYLVMFREAKKAPDERAPEFAAQLAEINTLLTILDGQLAAAEWLALGRMTLADIALAPIVARCLDFPIERPPLPALEAWRTRIAARPAFAKATAG
ncbi:glutathione S-transferase family protein [Roseomonas sp. KE2513]|uniref:glutathione S-transferase family protein n=1 Tax=Roseomonas sp. KE2513 TaxID=2479202 RepID=UPI0018DF209D|nr:glutathione S-transferase family protein [Roseomonas sp. KE2513]MBI0533973.1 glutathione S-transferase family protein [Roseomonas sp. KE2513]